MTTTSLAQAIGQNSRRLRLDAGVTLETLAAVVWVYGLPWTSGRVGDFEGGRVAPSLPTLLIVALALGDVTGVPVPLSSLLAGDGDVVLNEGLTLPIEVIRNAVTGCPVSIEPVKAPLNMVVETGGTVVLVDPLQMRESDHRLVRDIGAQPESALETMAELWGQVFSAERDGRAGAEANAQRKGQISRQLKVELVNALQAKQGGEDGNR